MFTNELNCQLKYDYIISTCYVVLHFFQRNMYIKESIVMYRLMYNVLTNSTSPLSADEITESLF